MVVESEELEAELAGNIEAGFSAVPERGVARPIVPGGSDHGQDGLFMSFVEVRR